ncbi:MAG: hypothetical protein HEP71_08280 [Roseivirga sp.]|nr:hypothetical protein [Roseivirga sp.]
MELKEELIEKVERYLSGELTRKEVKEENDTTPSDDELDEAIDLFNASKNLIELSGLREDLKSIHEEYIAETETEEDEVETKGKNSVWMWWTAAVAAAAILIAVFSGVFQNESPRFEDYFEAYPDLLSMRGNEGNMGNAMRYYSLQDYEAAIKEFDKLITDSLNHEVLFYQAIAALAVEQYKMAQSNLEKLKESKNNTYWQQTKWYLGLAYWQSGQIEKAKEILSSIEPGEDRYYGKARDLLNGL